MLTHVYLHLSVESIVEKKVVRHSNSMGLHWVSLPIVIVPYVPWADMDDLVIKISKSLHIKEKYVRVCVDIDSLGTCMIAKVT